MRKFNKVIGCGLPRCGGQSLQQAISIVTKRRVWHSISTDVQAIQPGDAGAVEMFHPMPALDKAFPDSLFIMNVRYNEEAWLASCKKLLHVSHQFTNPLWFHPPDMFMAYRRQYMANFGAWLYAPHSGNGNRALFWDITQDPRWEPLCDFLEVAIPKCDFPRTDAVIRKFGEAPC